MKKSLATIILVFACFTAMGTRTSTHAERKLIYSGNDLYKERKYDAAIEKYQSALKENGSSAEAAYNLGLCYLQIAGGKNLEEEKRNEFMQKGVELMEASAKYGATKPELASRANYNLGNIAFTKEDYNSALNLYKQALRLNPEDNDARRNLRITQLKLQNQDQNKDDNKDDQKDNKDQNEDKEKDKDKNNNDQNKNNQDQNKDEQKDKNQPKPQNNGGMSENAAKQILQAMENKENQTRNRLVNRQQNNNSESQHYGRKNW